jgi:YVTN family beta-propeller protein
MTATPTLPMNKPSPTKAIAPWRAPALHALVAVTVLLSACGGGGDDSNASDASGNAADRKQAEAASTSLPIAIPRDADPLLQGLTIPADAPTRGMWSATQSWPLNGLHAAVLPDGRVLTYGTPLNNPGSQDGRTYDVWNPALGFGANSHFTTTDAARVNSFCSTAAWRTDGRLMVTGGNSPLNAGLFSPATNSVVTDTATLADQRWYSTLLTLADGRLAMLGGMDPYNEGMSGNPDAAIANGTVSMTPELYTPGTGWRSLTGARSRDAFGPDYLRTSYPRAWVAPSGNVFGISAERMWSLDVSANGGAGAVTVLGNFKTPPSATAPVNVGATNTAVMFAPGRVLQVGGNGGFNGDGLPASNMATVVDFNGATPLVTETNAMNFRRRYANAVVLHDGKVVITGGTRQGNNGGADAVYEAEIWNPDTGTWTVGARAAQIRVYHSATVLLANGTVLSTGGGAPGPVNNQNAEIYYPPNLFRSVNGVAQLAPRPVMTGINALSFARGAQVQVEMLDATPVSRMTLVANGTVTHSFNSSQRFLPVTFAQNGDRITVTLPASAALAPPGYYQLAAVDAQGVPSRAVVIGIGMNGGAVTPPPPLTRGATYAFDAISSPGNAMATTVDAAALGVLAGAPAGSTPPANTQFRVRDGLADAACVSLESVASPGQWLRHQGFRLRLGVNDGSDLFRNDATFCPEAGLGGSGVTFRSRNFPGHMLRHRAGELWIDPQATDAAFAASAGFSARNVDAGGTPLPTVPSIPAAPLASGGTASYAPGLDAAGLTFSWSFGDGTAATAFSPTSAVSHTYASPGLYLVTLTVRNGANQTITRTFTQAVYGASTANAPRASSAMLLEPRTGGSTRLWVVNADNDSVSVFDTATNARVAEIATGGAPRTLARAADGRIWVANRDGASLTLINPATLAVATTVALPSASQPWGLVIAADGNAYVSLQATGRVLKLNGSTGAVLATADVGANPRHLSVTGDSARLLVSRFITPPLAGEATATVNTASGGGEVVVVATTSMAVQGTVRLAHSDRTDTEIQGSGLPNYLGAAVISPDGGGAWVPSKQDNVRRGTLRNGQNLDFQNTVRAISSRIDMGTLSEAPGLRVDHDNASLASAAAYDATGAYLFVALETSRQVEVVNARSGARLFRIETGLAPQGVVVSSDNTRLYALNFMSRSVSVVDVTPLTRFGELRSIAVATLPTVATDRLTATVLQGKRLFYDARDTRLARDAYMSCASCHNDGAHDGRTWDLTGMGEGLRNTPSLLGRAATGQGFVHWSANFDELQDFEGQIRALAGGTGLLTDAQFNTGTRNQPLGDRKAGVSADLDALAAYVASLTRFAPSPARNADRTLTAAATAGRAVFTAQNCASCHGGAGFTTSADATQLRNIGTLKSASGTRLGAPLTGIDIPTLRDVAFTAPYLHDGSAPTLAAAVQAHAGNTVAGTDLDNLVAYLQQIGSEEGPAPASNQPPSNAVSCASEGGTCTLPAGSTATVWYGAASSWAVRTGVTGSIACTNAVFGDPLRGTRKACRYLVTSVATNRPPTVSLTAPANGASVVQGTAVTLTASAADPDGSVARVEFYDGATLLATDSTAPYSFGWSGAAVGAHTLTARAVDNLGATTTSTAVTLTITAPTPTTPPSNAVSCANEGGTCTLPAGATATVWYGAASSWAVRTRVTGSIACTNAVFGDPLYGTVKSCRYLRN